MPKKARVKTIKQNVQKGTTTPNFRNDCDAGFWVDNELANNGIVVDKNGVVDLPEFGIDNKSRKKGSKANHTVGSITIAAIEATSKIEETRLWPKMQNQNQVTYDETFREITSVEVLDMDLPEIQDKFKSDYADLHTQVINGNRKKTIYGKNGWLVLDGYGHEGSYRLRITDWAMKQIRTLSRSRDTRNKLFEGL